MNVVKTGPTESSYGAQRIFGSLGFSLASFVSGVCADHFEVVGMRWKHFHYNKFSVLMWWIFSVDQRFWYEIQLCDFNIFSTFVIQLILGQRYYETYTIQFFCSRYTAVFLLYLPCTVLLIPFGVYLVGQTRWNDTKVRMVVFGQIGYKIGKQITQIVFACSL